MPKNPAEKNYLKLKPGKNAFNFGKVVAEQDLELQDYYVDPDRYVARALDFNDSAVFFVGPKGAGKSAILQMVRLIRAPDAGRVINISPDDLAFSALANVNVSTPVLSEVAKHQWLFKSLWDYILSLEVLRREYKDRNTFTAFLGGLVRSLFGYQHDEEARRLLSISLGDEGQQQSLSKRILQLVNEVEVSAEVPQSAKVAGKAKIDNTQAGQGRHLWLLSLINSVAKKIGDSVRSPYHILIDDLDLHWHDSPVQNAFIAALFFSLRNFSKPPNIRCAVAIRDQIYRRLPLVDRDKYHDWVCQVEWDEPNVRKMVERRITSRLDIPTKDIWGGLFPKSAFTRMMRHSYGRPREAIRLVSMCILEAQRKGHLRVDEQDLDQGIRKFSDQRIAEIASEFSHQYGGLDQITRKFRGWPREFQVARLTEMAEEIWLEIQCGEEIAQEYLWAGGFCEDPRALARILLECSIILYKHDRTAEPVMYDLDSRPEIKDDTWVAIHPAFLPALGA
jgi:hypothetical protein